LAAVLWLAIHRLTESHEQSARVSDAAPDEDAHADWGVFGVLLVLTCLAGIVYAALMTFMPRYLDGAGLSLGGISRESLRNYSTGLVLLLGMVGQYVGGRLARPATLEPLLAGAFLVSAPCVLWMAFAEGAWRLAAAGLFAPLYFMHQPLYNSMVAKYVPRRRRSLAYGLSFSTGLGVGGLGSAFAGYVDNDLVKYGTLAGALFLGTLVAAGLWLRNRQGSPPETAARRP